MTTFLLVRHAAHDWLGRGIPGRMPISINAQGWLQAESLVRRLEGRDIAAIYSSPQPRAQQTVAPLAGRRRLQIRLLEGFDEIDFGQWTGRTFDQLQVEDAQRWHAWCHHRGTAQPPGGEPFIQVRDRAMRALEQLRTRYPAGTVLIASHGDVIKAVLATALHLSLDDLERFEVAPASISILEAGEGWQKVRLLNCEPLAPAAFA